MDVNYYLHREQVERMRAARADSARASAIHSEMADLYRARILAYRTRATVAPHPAEIPVKARLIIPAAA